MIRNLLLTAVFMCTASAANAATATINQIDANGVGAALGTITLEDSRYGLVLTPALAGLPPGAHGFHIHEKGSCAPGEKDGKVAAGLGAGGHYDPGKTGQHLGPHATDEHKGDLPMLVVDQNGKAVLPMLAPHLKAADVRGRALMIHAGGDNFADNPAPLGGGGGRIACGVIE